MSTLKSFVNTKMSDFISPFNFAQKDSKCLYSVNMIKYQGYIFTECFTERTANNTKIAVVFQSKSLQ